MLLYGVYPKAVVTLPDVKVNVPPNVKFPLVVTVPDKLSPLTVPVPPTDVTVPVLVVYPLGFVALYGVNPNPLVTCPDVNVICDEPDTKPEGTPVILPNETCADPETIPEGIPVKLP